MSADISRLSYILLDTPTTPIHCLTTGWDLNLVDLEKNFCYPLKCETERQLVSDLVAIATDETVAPYPNADDAKLGSDEISFDLIPLRAESQKIDLKSNKFIFQAHSLKLTSSILTAVPHLVPLGLRGVDIFSCDAERMSYFIMDLIDQGAEMIISKRNHGDFEGGARIASSLPGNQTLKVLVLHRNYVHNNAIHIMRALISNQIEELDLSSTGWDWCFPLEPLTIARPLRYLNVTHTGPVSYKEGEEATLVAQKEYADWISHLFRTSQIEHVAYSIEGGMDQVPIVEIAKQNPHLKKVTISYPTCFWLDGNYEEKLQLVQKLQKRVDRTLFLKKLFL